MMKNRAIASTCLLILLLAASACSSVRTRIDYDPDIDFSQWKTWSWYDRVSQITGDPRDDDPLLAQRIIKAIERDLAARGYVQVGPDQTPDFFVNHLFIRDSRLDVRVINRSYHHAPMGRSWGTRGWGGVGWSETRVREIEEGTILIDLLDSKSRELVWRGSGTQRVPSDLQGDALTRRIDEIVGQIVRRFPERTAD